MAGQSRMETQEDKEGQTDTPHSLPRQRYSLVSVVRTRVKDSSLVHVCGLFVPNSKRARACKLKSHGLRSCTFINRALVTRHTASLKFLADKYRFVCALWHDYSNYPSRQHCLLELFFSAGQDYTLFQQQFIWKRISTCRTKLDKRSKFSQHA